MAWFNKNETVMLSMDNYEKCDRYDSCVFYDKVSCNCLLYTSYLIVAVRQRSAAEIRCYPYLVCRHEVGADIELFLADMGEVFRCPPVVRLATSDVAGLDVD